MQNILVHKRIERSSYYPIEKTQYIEVPTDNFILTELFKMAIRKNLQCKLRDMELIIYGEKHEHNFKYLKISSVGVNDIEL